MTRLPLPRGHGADILAVAALLTAVTLSLADGLLGDVVAAERDTIVQYYPLSVWARNELHRGQLPLWSPVIFGGYPIFADGEEGLACPPVLLALLALRADRAFVLLRLFHLSVAGLGCYALARTWRLPPAAATLAGVVFSLGSFLQAHIHHESIVRTAAWLPPALALAENALRARGRARLGWTVGAGMAVGLAGLGLHPQLLAIDLVTLAAYGAFRLWAGPICSTVDHRWGRARVIALVLPGLMALGLALAAVQLVPLVELGQLSVRSEFSYEQAAAYSLSPSGLLQLIFPFMLHDASARDWTLWQHWESDLYVGLASLLLAILAMATFRRREVRGWMLLGAGGLALALGPHNPLNVHYLFWLLTGQAGLRAPGRFSLIVVLALSMLAAYGLARLQWRAADKLAESPDFRERRAAIVLLGLPFALAAALGAFGLTLHLAPDTARAVVAALHPSLLAETHRVAEADIDAGLLWATDLANPGVAGTLIALFGIASCLYVWQWAPWPRVRHWRGWPIVLVLAASADLLLFSRGIHPRESLAHLTATSPAARIVSQLAARRSESGPFRVLAAPGLHPLAPDRLAPLGLQEASGYSSLESRWHHDYLQRVLQADDQLLDLWGIRYLLQPAGYTSPATSNSKYRELYRDRDVVLLENLAAYPRAFVVSRARIAPDPDAMLDDLVGQPFHAAEEVVLAGDMPGEPMADPRPSSGGSSRPDQEDLPDAAHPSPARVERYEPQDVLISVAAPTDGFLVLSDAYYPGWHAFVDREERPLLRGDLLFRVVPVPAGLHTVQFQFNPSSLQLGMALSALALAVVLAVLAIVVWPRAARQMAS